MALWGLLRFGEEHDVIDWLKTADNGAHRQTQLFGATTDIDASFREAGGDFMLRTIDHFSPETTAVTAAIRGDADTMAAFDALVRDEGKEVLTELEDLMKDENGQPVDPQQFAQMLQDPAQRSLFNQALRATATDEHDMADMINFARTGIALSRDPTNTERQQRFREQATAMGIDTSQIESQAMMGMFRNFMQDPAGSLYSMGMDPQLIAALEPLLKFFTSSMDYYANGGPGQPGLIQITGNIMEQSHARGLEIEAQYGGTVAAEAGQYARDDRGRIVQAVAAPADLEDGDVDPERRGRQQFANLGGNRRALVTVDDERNIVYRGVTDTEFESVGGTQVRSELKLADVFAPRSEGRPQTEPETAAAQQFNTGMAAAARTWAPGQ